MLLPQTLIDLVSTTESTAMSLLTPCNWAEMNPLIDAMNGALMTCAFVVPFEALSAA